jgi:hypothetical protein
MHKGEPDFLRTIYYSSLMIGAIVGVNTFARRLKIEWRGRGASTLNALALKSRHSSFRSPRSGRNTDRCWIACSSEVT